MMEEIESKPVAVERKQHRRGKILLFDALNSYEVIGRQVTRFRAEFSRLDRRLVMACISIYLSDGKTLVYNKKQTGNANEFWIKNGNGYQLTAMGWIMVNACIFALRHSRERGKARRKDYGIKGNFND
jgi:hypothetical protein